MKNILCKYLFDYFSFFQWIVIICSRGNFVQIEPPLLRLHGNILCAIKIIYCRNRLNVVRFMYLPLSMYLCTCFIFKQVLLFLILAVCRSIYFHIILLYYWTRAIYYYIAVYSIKLYYCFSAQYIATSICFEIILYDLIFKTTFFGLLAVLHK